MAQMRRELLRDVGEAHTGPRWQSELARDLNIADRTMRRWLSGSDNLPDGVALDLMRLCTERAQTLDDLTGSLRFVTAGEGNA